MPAPRYGRMPESARSLACHAVIGFSLVAGFVLALLLADPGGLGCLLRDPASGALPLALLWGFTSLTFATVQLGFAFWLEAED